MALKSFTTPLVATFFSMRSPSMSRRGSGAVFHCSRTARLASATFFSTAVSILRFFSSPANPVFLASTGAALRGSLSMAAMAPAKSRPEEETATTSSSSFEEEESCEEESRSPCSPSSIASSCS